MSCWIQPLAESRPPTPVDAAGAPMLIVVGSTGDVAAPIEAARQAVNNLDHAVLITVESHIHAGVRDAMSNSGPPEQRCLVDLIDAYLIDLEAPATKVFERRAAGR